MEEEENMRRSESSLPTSTSANDGNGHLERSVSNGSAITASQEDGFRMQSKSISAGSVKNKYLDRIRSESMPYGSRKRTSSNNNQLPDQQPIWEKRPGFSSSRSLASLKKEVSRPMYRKDIFYSGSVRS